MNVRGSAASLAQAVKDLSLEWDRTKSYWRDVKGRQFEHQYLEPLPGYVARTVATIEEIDALLRKVRSDCE
jgi:hypothetical protein